VKRPPYEVARLSEIPITPVDEFDFVWRQIRHFFGIREFSANVFTGEAVGDEIVHEHAERPNDDASEVGDEELYVVLSGRALARLDGEEREVEAGTFVFVGEPSTVRSLTALEAGTTVLAVGTNPGVRFVVSRWEQERSPPARWESAAEDGRLAGQ
jgi:hypothetical protein